MSINNWIILLFQLLEVFFASSQYTCIRAVTKSSRPFVSPVQEVDGVAPVVLNVPAERGETHAHIKPGYLHARDVHIDVGEHRLLQHWHVVEVPA